MDNHAISLQRKMQRAAQDLHQSADALVNYLENHPDLNGLSDDSAEGDVARAALDGARRWRSMMESGE
jgi:hypothetical protein